MESIMLRKLEKVENHMISPMWDRKQQRTKQNSKTSQIKDEFNVINQVIPINLRNGRKWFYELQT